MTRLNRLTIPTIAAVATASMATAAPAVSNERASAQAVQAQPPSLRVGCINLSYIAANSKQGKVAMGELETFAKKKQSEIEERAKTLDEQEARLRRESATLTEPARLKLEQSVRKAQLELTRFREDTQSEVQQFADRVERELRARLFPIVDEISREKGLSLVFTVDAPGLVWFSEAVDVSPDVVTRLDRPEKPK